MSFSNAFETTVLNWALTAGSATRPTAWYVALYTSDPTDADSGTEVSGGSYARKAVTFTVSGATASNSSAVAFSAATATWGTVTHVGIRDALSGGNLIAHAALSAGKLIESGDVLNFPTGDITVTLD